MENERVSIRLPNTFTHEQFERLKRIIEEQSAKLKKELDIDELPIIQDESILVFKWFRNEDIAYNGDEWLKFFSDIYGQAKEE